MTNINEISSYFDTKGLAVSKQLNENLNTEIIAKNTQNFNVLKVEKEPIKKEKTAKISMQDFIDFYAYKNSDFQISNERFLINDFIEKGSLNLIYARAKQGKSNFMFSLYNYLAEINADLQFFYIDNDQSTKTAKKRGFDEATKKFKNFHYIGKRKIKDLGGKKELFKTLENLQDLDKCVFCFDTLRNFFKGDMNSDVFVTEFMNAFENIREYGATIFLLHHAKKTDKETQRGSDGIIESCDNIFQLENLIKQSKQQLNFDKNVFIFMLNLKDSRDNDDGVLKAFKIKNDPLNFEFKEIELNEAYEILLPPICIKAYEILSQNGDLNQKKSYVNN